MGRNFVYVDNSNVFIEGSRLSAVARGLPGAGTLVEAMNNHVVDHNWMLDYGALHQFACGDPLWHSGFKIVVHASILRV